MKKIDLTMNEKINDETAQKYQKIDLKRASK